MNYFIVTLLDKGKKKHIPLYAKNKRDATHKTKLKYSGLIIKVVQTEEPFEIKLQKFKTNLLKNVQQTKLKQDALIAAIRQLAVMSNAGISIHDSLQEIANSSEDKNLKFLFNNLADDINSGKSLSSSMQNYHYELGNLTIAMVQLGEKTGNLDEALYTLANMLEEIRSNYIKFKKAMAYPRNVMIAMAVAFSVLISFVVPKFETMFKKLHADLPIPTKILMALEHLFNNYGGYLLASGLLIFLLLKYLIETYPDIRYKWHSFLLKTYLINRIIKFSTLSRFTLVFSELVRAGIPIAEALQTATSMVENLPLKKKLMRVRATVEKGGTLNKGLKDIDLFENMIIQMIRAGEDSGTLDTMIKKVAQYYKMKFDAIIDGLSEAIEPIMLFLIASLVILLALGIFLPMWDLGNAVQGR